MNGDGRPRRCAETRRGVALIAVLAILSALLLMAMPFMLSMRNHERSTSVAIDHARTAQSARAALAAAEAVISKTDPSLDPTPHYDSLAELEVDLASAFVRFGENVNDPKGAIRSARVTDEQGKVDINTCSPYLLSNLVNPMRLAGEIDADEEKTLIVSDAERLPESGLVWIDGEIILYKSKSGRQLMDLVRGFSTSVLTSLPRSEHGNGRPVVDYRVLLAGVYAYKAAGEPKNKTAGLTAFATPRSIKDIARFGEMGFTSDDIDRFIDRITTYAVAPSGSRFGFEARALGAYGSRSHPAPVEVTGPSDFNPGTVVRLRAGDRVEYNLVVAAEELGPGRLSILLQEAPRFDYAADELLVAPLLRAPVNVNTCSRDVLIALLLGLKRRVDPAGIDLDTATFLATRIEKARPIEGESGFAKLLRELRADASASQIVTDAVARTVLTNALDALDTSLETSTAPFCYRSLGNVSIEAAVSENLAAGREAGRAFAREVISTAAGGTRQTVISSQIGFSEFAPLSRYWTTYPVNVADIDGFNDPPVPVESYLDHGRYPAVSDEEQTAIEATGRTEFARSRPVAKSGYRDATATAGGRVLHCDEPFVAKKASALKEPQIDDPDGWDVSVRGPRSFSVVDPALDLIDPTSDLVKPFAFELWWTPGETEGEQFFFDSGQSELTNRILAYFDGTAITFRVADSTVPEYAIDGSNWPTTMAEIRYAFDDGLPFERDAWYHLSFYARGTKPTDLALFVDGIPRGKRKFVTRLEKSVGPVQVIQGPFSKIKGYGNQGAEALSVKDASVFPPYGVVRVGDELMEYTGKVDDKNRLLLTPAGDEPFGGRARRGTSADVPTTVVKSGSQQAAKVVHEAARTVELYGYSTIIAQRRIPNGDSQINGTIGRFAVAMVDPNAKEAKQEIKALDRSGNEIRVGVGLPGTEANIPITGLAKPTTSSNSSSTGSAASLGDGAFQQDGGFALLVSATRPPPSSSTAPIQIPAQPGQNPNQPTQDVVAHWDLPWDSVNGMIGRIEIIYYSSYDGGVLRNCARAGPNFSTGFDWQPKSNLAGQSGNQGNWIASRGHDHVSTWDPWLMNSKEAQGHDRTQPICVFPISIRVGKTVNAASNEWAIPEVSGGGGGGGGGGGPGSGQGGSTRPEMIQIGIGFNSGAQGGTEWVRYDTIANGCFVRDNPERLENAGELLGRFLTERYTSKNGTIPSSELVARAVNFENIATNDEEKQEIVSGLGSGGAAQGAVGADSIEELLNDNFGCLAFRGVLGTGDRSHGGGDRALPVFRTIRGPDPDFGRPGARDFITLVDPVNGSREEHRINFGYCEPNVEGWGWSACHVGLDAGVDGTFISNFADMLYAIDPADSDVGWKELANQALDSRLIARMLKFPTGELPLTLGEELYFGADFNGDRSPAGGKFDEIEFFTPTTPDPAFINHHFILANFDEKKGEVWVYAWRLRDAMRRKGGVAIEAIDPITKLPTDGIVLQIGEELVACKDWRIEQESVGNGSEAFAVFEVAEAGRGYLGTPIQSHGHGDAVREMTFLRVSRLMKDFGADDNVLRIGDISDFDDRGVVAVGLELVGYTRKQAGNQLFMPPYDDGSGKTIGLLRGSYGTGREKHRADSLAYQFPVRYLDRYRPVSDDSELGFLTIPFVEKRAFFKEMSYTATGETKYTKLVVEALVGDRGSFSDPPGTNPDRFTFGDDRFSATGGKEILRQGDSLELRVATRYLDGAFDSRVFEPDPDADRGGRNDWKRAPELRALGLEWIASPARLAYEEWR